MTHSENNVIPLSRVGLIASRIGIGTWAIGGGWGPQPEERSLAALHKALESGCLLIDTAALYGNGRAERLIAQAFKEYGSRVTTITKIYPSHYHWAPAPGTRIETIYPKEHILTQVEGSLRCLDTDCLDAVLFQTWCPSWGEEMTWYETMCDLQRAGKIRAFGISVSDHRPDEANSVIAAQKVDLIEAPYSLLDQRAAVHLFPLAQQYNVSIIARTPLASGALTGHWHTGMKFHRQDWRKRVFKDALFEQTLQRVARLQSFVDPTLPLTHVALRFCLDHPAIAAVIPGVRSREQVQCNLSTIEGPPLSQELCAELAEVWRLEMSNHIRTSIGEEGKG